MRQGQNRSRTSGWLGRWLLLACTLVGLAAMHSLGHGGADHVRAVTDNAVTRMMGAEPVAVSDCDGCSHLSGPHQHDMTMRDVCLAVLTAFAVVLLLAVLRLSRSRARTAPGSVQHSYAVGPRAPPSALVGLTLATVSVRRT